MISLAEPGTNDQNSMFPEYKPFIDSCPEDTHCIICTNRLPEQIN